MLQKTHDSLNRRIRTTPTSTGKRVVLNDRDIFWLEFLHRHRGPLPATVLHEATAHIHKNPKSTRIRLADLFHEKSTDDAYRYLIRPDEQTAAKNDMWQTRVYDLSVTAVRYLKREGLWHDDAPHLDSWWKHQYLVANITASIEIECRKRGWRYIPGHEILARGRAQLRYNVPYDRDGKEVSKMLIPDAIFAIDYGGAYRVFIVEGDRGTEQLEYHEARKSFERNILQYRSYIGGGLYKEHLKLNAGMVVLNVTTSKSRADSMLRILEDVAGKNTYQCVQFVEGQGKQWKPTGPWPHLFEGGWKRAGCPDFHITDI